MGVEFREAEPTVRVVVGDSVGFLLSVPGDTENSWRQKRPYRSCNPVEKRGVQRIPDGSSDDPIGLMPTRAASSGGFTRAVSTARRSFGQSDTLRLMRASMHLRDSDSMVAIPAVAPWIPLPSSDIGIDRPSAAIRFDPAEGDGTRRTPARGIWIVDTAARQPIPQWCDRRGVRTARA